MLNEENFMEYKLIKRIISRKKEESVENIDEYGEFEHIFELADGTKIDVTKMNSMQIASFAFKNYDSDGNIIFNFITPEQKISKYATLLSIYTMLELEAMLGRNKTTNSQKTSEQKIFDIIENLGGKYMLDEIFRKVRLSGSSFSEALVKEANLEIDEVIKTF